MLIQNVSKQTTLADKGRVADSFWLRLRGLMGARSFGAHDALLITPANSVHTHFMRMVIDVVYLDDSHRVVDVVSAMRPWRMAWPRRAQSVLELPAGRAQETDCAVGDQLRIVC